MAEKVQEKFERNIDLVKDYYALDDNGEWLYGATTDLVRMYNISFSRINFKLASWGFPTRTELRGKKVSEVLTLANEFIEKVTKRGGVL